MEFAKRLHQEIITLKENREMKKSKNQHHCSGGSRSAGPACRLLREAEYDDHRSRR
jgi:hypothetical protein